MVRIDRVRAADMLGEHDPAAGPQHPLRLADRGSVVRDRAEPVGADDGVEEVIGEVERLGVADSHVDLTPQVLGPLAPQRDHLRAEARPR